MVPGAAKSLFSRAMAPSMIEFCFIFFYYFGDITNFRGFSLILRPALLLSGCRSTPARGMQPALTERKATQCLEETQTFIRL